MAERMVRGWQTATVATVASVLLSISGPGMAAAKATHEAMPGQSLAEVANEHGVSVNALAAVNDVAPDAVFDEPTALIVPGEGDNPSVPNDVAAVAYIVVEGDTIETIAGDLGVTVADLVATNNLDNPDLLEIGQRLLVPTSSGSATSPDEAYSGVFVEGIPAYQQARSLSCEYASVYIATSAFGDPINEEEYLASTPSADNPHFGYRGDIDGVWGRTDDYGIYVEPLVPTLNAHGYAGEVSYGADASVLRAHLDAGHPVVVWIATRGDTGFYETDADGNSFKLVPWEHVVVAYGYDADRVYISDPGAGTFSSMDWDSFLSAWSVMDGMALAVYPM